MQKIFGVIGCVSVSYAFFRVIYTPVLLNGGMQAEHSPNEERQPPPRPPFSERSECRGERCAGGAEHSGCAEPQTRSDNRHRDPHLAREAGVAGSGVRVARIVGGTLTASLVVIR